METPNPNNFEREPDVYRMTPEEIQRNFSGDKEALGLSGQQEVVDDLEALEAEPDYIEKLTMTPLPLDKMSELLQQVAGQYAEDDGSRQALFNKAFVGSMQMTLHKLMESAKPGDNITFDDLSWAAETATEHTKKINPDSILNDPSFVEETNAIAGITERFAGFFDQRPDLEYIGDDIDAFTVHSDVHTYHKDRIKANPDKDTFGEEHGANGRWIPEKRGGMTVWVTKEQKQQETKEAHETEARTAVEEAYGVDVPENPTGDTHNIPEQGNPDSQTEMLAKVPDDRRERILFAKENFTGRFDSEKTPLLAAFLTKELAGIASRVPEGSRYPDTVAAVVGNGGDTWHYLRAVLTAKTGKNLQPNDFSRLPFSEVARTIGIDVKKVVPDYEQRFSPR
ncbi:hypothetical protein KC992_00290 [Candidatus Saccharibacteria bacterium]|nr:hypothetical protein [Candidatus Saccharibacteria bacterium]